MARRTVRTLSIFFLFSFLAKALVAQTAALTPYGLIGKKVTALTSRAVDAGGVIRPEESLFAATSSNGVYAIEPFGSQVLWKYIGLEKRNITALTVQQWGVGPRDGLRLYAGITEATGSQEPLIYRRETLFETDTAWVPSDSNLDRNKIQSIKSLTAFYSTGHVPPMPAFAAGHNGIFRAQWSDWSDVLPTESPLINAIDAKPNSWSSGDRVVVAVGSKNLSPVFYRSPDLGTTWRAKMLPSMIEAEAYSVAIDPTALNRIYIGMRNTIWMSDDSGATWKNIFTTPKQVDIRAIAIDPRQHENIFASGSNTVNDFVFYHSSDGGVSWKQIIPMVKIPIVGLSSIVVMNHPTKTSETNVFLGTLGTGVWSYTPYAATTSVTDAMSGSSISKLDVFPQPARNEVNFRYSLASRSTVRIELFDLLGKKLATILDAEQESGTHHTTLNSDEHPLHSIRGMYICRMTTADVTLTKLFLITGE